MQAALEGGVATSRPANRDSCGGGVLLSCVPAAGVPSDDTSSSAARMYFIFIVRYRCGGSLLKLDGRSFRNRIIDLHADAD
jgi:hypothetical protein